MLSPRPEPQAPWLVQILLKAGLKNQRQAEIVLLVFAGFCILFSFWMISGEKDVELPNDPLLNPNYEPQ